ncbi:response regulator [Pseudoxanthomonas sp. Root630]|uniref:response regulator n=1 Tax=Pseudoxanthomonas sp. Root630 TaxID=1736574 RepID=UPI0007039487|nr:response regulator [Pseudoxanthomonas sp. Root630]KRA48748.1 hypothetical protein ASD72_19505 [Pseudoxanthomonas sp. Root630]
MSPGASPPGVFVVEDESLLLMLLEDLLPEMGYTVLASAGSVADALANLSAIAPDVAVVDVNLAGTPSFPVAEALRARGIPFLFTTGYGQEGLPAHYADVPVLAKPFRRHDLEVALARLHPVAK